VISFINSVANFDYVQTDLSSDIEGFHLFSEMSVETHHWYRVKNALLSVTELVLLVVITGQWRTTRTDKFTVFISNTWYDGKNETKFVGG
jgi:hypothetical protein